jgi:hypothetical protein
MWLASSVADLYIERKTWQSAKIIDSSLMQLVHMAPVFPLILLLLSSSCLGSDEHANELGYMVVPASSLKHIADGAVCSGHKGAYVAVLMQISSIDR